MNKQNILAVAYAIERHSIPDLGFNMQYWGAPTTKEVPDRTGHNCGTVACIAGWASRLSLGRPLTGRDDAYSIGDDFIGIGNKVDGLFMPSFKNWNDVSPAHAVAVLRHLAETGKVDWSVTE